MAAYLGSPLADRAVSVQDKVLIQHVNPGVRGDGSRRAYRNSYTIERRSVRVKLVGRSNGYTVEMWVNTVTNDLKTAYPLYFSGGGGGGGGVAGRFM